MADNLLHNPVVSACRRAWLATGPSPWLLAVSGGADSVALLVACNLAGAKFEVAHCNFNLRGAESLRDRDFTLSLCEKMGVKVYTAEFDVSTQSLAGESVEMACRRLRYDFFHALKTKYNFSRIVVAHNADDNIETFFLNALRGSGTRGLKAMTEDNGSILRPLLPFTRSSLLDFLEINATRHIEDSTNRLSEYRRNFIRNEIFPLLQTKWPGFQKALTTTINRIQHENKIVEYALSKALEGVSDLLPWTTIDSFPDSLTLISRFIKPWGGTSTTATEIVNSSLARTPGKFWMLSEGKSARLTKKGILILDSVAPNLPDPDNFKWSKVETADLDMAKIKSAPLSFLYVSSLPEEFEWRTADKNLRIKPLGMAGTQSVWKVLKDAGLSTQLRELYPVLVDKSDGSVVWIPGIKRSRLHLVSPNSNHIFILRPID